LKLSSNFSIPSLWEGWDQVAGAGAGVFNENGSVSFRKKPRPDLDEKSG
jgi:hypothetical protein